MQRFQMVARRYRLRGFATTLRLTVPVFALLSCSLDHRVQCIRCLPISFVGRVLIDQGGSRTRMPKSSHDLYERRAGLSSEGAAGVSEVVQVQVGPCPPVLSPADGPATARTPADKL